MTLVTVVICMFQEHPDVDAHARFYNASSSDRWSARNSANVHDKGHSAIAVLR